METLSTICSILIIICIFLIPATFTVFIIMACIKNKLKKLFGFITLGLLSAIILFTIFGVLTYPATWCKHQWKDIETINSSCTEKGHTTKQCSLCGRTRTDYFEKLEHQWVEFKRLEPQINVDGEIIKECKLCGKQIVEKIPGIEPTQTENKESTTFYSKNTTEDTTEATTKAMNYVEEFAKDNGISVKLAQSMDNAIQQIKDKYYQKFTLEQAHNFEQVEDWAYGKRYEIYLDYQYVLYIYEQNDEVTSIRTSNGEFAYQK